MFDHSISKFHGMTHDLDLYIISITLNISLFLKIDTNIVFLYSSDISLDRNMLLNKLVSHNITIFSKHLQNSIRISSDGNALCVFILSEINVNNLGFK
jgi:hypothetical protein